MSNYKHGNWYCIPNTEAEAEEIIQLAVKSGADNLFGCEGDSVAPYGVVDGAAVMGRVGGTRYTIEQLREKFGAPVNQCNGEDLPPVGMVCEAYCDSVSPEKCRFIESDDRDAVVKWDKFNAGGYDVLPLSHWKFRPLRTEREKWIDKVCNDLSGDMEELKHAELIAGQIYDAGLAKDVEE